MTEIYSTLPTSKISLPSGALGRLRSQQDFLSPSLRRVTEYILANAELVVYQTITELATAVGVGEASITRLCRKLDFPGFHAFKISLTSDLAVQGNEMPRQGEGMLYRADQAVHQSTFALESTRRILEPEVVESVARALMTAHRVEISGQGYSGLAAQFFAQKLLRVGIAAFAHSDPHISAVSASTLTSGDVLIGITRSGSTIDTVQNLKAAFQTGAFTVAITHRATSPITQYAREVLYTASPESPLAGGAISSLTSQILLLEVLYLELFAHLQSASDIIRKTAEAVVEKKF